MRSFSFHAKTIGKERYLTYILGEGMELDEDTLDFMEEEGSEELVRVIFEQDEDYDYLTYDISGKVSLQKYTSGVVSKELVLKILRNISLGLINCKEQALHLAYILLHKDFIYIDQDSLKMQFICLPVEGEASVSTEFKGFVRQLIANFKYDLDGDVTYVGTLLAFINGDTFNLRNLIGLTEALMEDEGITYDAEESISTEDGEVVDSAAPVPEEKSISSFMDDIADSGEALPEIGDDEEEAEEEPAEEEAEETEEVEEASEETEEAEEAEEEAEDDEVELTEAEPEAVEDEAEETEEEPEAAEEEPEEPAEPTLEELAEKAKRLAEEAKLATRGARTSSKNIKVSRAAIIQNAAAQEAEIVQETGDREATDLLRGDEPAEVTRESKNAKEKKNVVTEDINNVNASKEAEAEEKAAKSKSKGKGKKEAPAPAPVAASTGQTGTLSTNDGATIKVNPYLIRETTEERTMITKAVFKIGKANRGVDYHVSGNGAISRQHAIITRKDDGYYIKDNKSTNHTYVNGKELEDGEEVLLTNNCRIRLGDEEFLFKY